MNVIEIIQQDYSNFPKDQTYDIYAEDVYFEDPLNKFTGIERYRKMILFLATFFKNIELELLSIQQKENIITTEWILNMNSPLPWKPRISIPGWSELTLNEADLIISHCDRWKISPWEVLKQNFVKK